MGNVVRVKAACARSVGRSHLASHTPCQDYVCIQRDAKNRLISLSLSDGAGSCSLSHVGSRIIAKTTNSYLIKHFHSFFATPNMGELLLNKIKQTLQLRADKDKSSSLKPYSGTLLCVATDGQKYMALHLGDGVIGYMENHQPKVLSMPSNGEYANTTFFVTDVDAHTHLKIYSGEVCSIQSFVLMSDGTQESLYDKKNHLLASGYHSLFSWLNDLSEKKASSVLAQNTEKIFAQKSTDDCSIAIVNILRDV